MTEETSISKGTSKSAKTKETSSELRKRKPTDDQLKSPKTSEKQAEKQQKTVKKPVSGSPQRRTKDEPKSKNVVEPVQYKIASWTFSRLMGILYILAFLSIQWQIKALIGSEGISPFQEFFARISSTASEFGFRTHPSILWFITDDDYLIWICWLGVASGVTLFLDIVPFVSAFVAWAIFLSICVAGQTFFMTDWDTLLLETGFLTILIQPFHFKVKPWKQAISRPPRVILWCFWWLLIRVHFLRGFHEFLGPDEHFAHSRRLVRQELV
jgi:hypothetical protein